MSFCGERGDHLRRGPKRREKKGKANLSVHNDDLDVGGQLVRTLELVGQQNEQLGHRHKVLLQHTCGFPSYQSIGKQRKERKEEKRRLAIDHVVIHDNATLVGQEPGHGHQVAVFTLLRHDTQSQTSDLFSNKFLFEFFQNVIEEKSALKKQARD